MSRQEVCSGGDERWGRFRFSVVGHLLAAPPEKGKLHEALLALSQKPWKHPVSGERVLFSVPTLERWYYQALSARGNPVVELSRKVREDSGTHKSMSAALAEALRGQYAEHPEWSYQLHADNLAVVAGEKRLGKCPCYESVYRYMKAHGLVKRRLPGGGRNTAGARAAQVRFEQLEVRSYESEHVNALWHLDFHHGSVPVLLEDGQWVYPVLLAILDDCSRFCIHAQWYLEETARNLVHALLQAFQKGNLPRALMSDNGSPMIAHETTEGLARLGIVHEQTLPYSPYQNGKQESFWGPVEGRLLAMIRGAQDVTLGLLNEATLAWAQMEYNRKEHSELRQKPVEVFSSAGSLARRCPCWEELELAFTASQMRKQRFSDGTISLMGRRYEVPSRYRQMERLCVRFASWDLSRVWLADERNGHILVRLFPLDKHKNADGRRRVKETPASGPVPAVAPPSGQMAPLLRKLVADYAATGLPPAYLPQQDNGQDKEQEHE